MGAATASAVGEGKKMTAQGLLMAACSTLPVGSAMRKEMVTLEAANQILSNPLEYARIKAGTFGDLGCGVQHMWHSKTQMCLAYARAQLLSAC